MRLREYLERQKKIEADKVSAAEREQVTSKLLKHLHESVEDDEYETDVEDYEDYEEDDEWDEDDEDGYAGPDLVDQIKECYKKNSPMPAAFITELIDAPYTVSETGESYGAYEKELYSMEEVEVPYSFSDVNKSPQSGFGDSVYDYLTDLVGGIGTFYLLEVKANDGSTYEFYMAALPSEDLDFEMYAKNLVMVNEQHDICETRKNIAYDTFIKVLDEFGRTCGAQTVGEALGMLGISIEDNQLNDQSQLEENINGNADKYYKLVESASTSTKKRL